MVTNEAAMSVSERLVLDGRMTRAQAGEAAAHASAHHTSVEQALITLKLADERAVGETLALLHGMEYHPLPAQIPPYSARRLVSYKCAARWGLIPLSYENDTHALTLAVSHPSRAEQWRKIHRFFLRPHILNFQIASAPEIAGELKKHFGDVDQWPQTWTRKPSAISGMAGDAVTDEVPAATARTAPAAETVPAAAVADKPDAPRGELPYRAMSRALIGLVSTLVRSRLAADDASAEDVLSHVRYAQLLTSRLKLSPVTGDGAELAAWLAPLDDERRAALLNELNVPYPLREIVDQARDEAEPHLTESRMLRLILAYHALRRTSPEDSRDVNAARRHLQRTCGASFDENDMLEMFLQILVDEDFLSKTDRQAGRILIVDPAETAHPLLAPPLSAYGFQATVVSTAADAAARLGKTRVDLVIAAATLVDRDALSFCRSLKRAPETADTPVIMLTDPHDEKRATECLRAGADDFLPRPVNIELLLLKMQRLLPQADVDPRESGVKGSLSQMSFTDMIQILCAGGRSIEIQLSNAGQDAHIHIQDGNVMHAQLGDTEGENAFYGLMRWEEGEFQTRPCSEFPARNVQVPLMSLLMEGARLIDEQSEAPAAPDAA